MVRGKDGPPAFGDDDPIKEFPKCKGARRGDPRFMEHDFEQIASIGGNRRYKCKLCGQELFEHQIPQSYWDQD